MSKSVKRSTATLDIVLFTLTLDQLSPFISLSLSLFFSFSLHLSVNISFSHYSKLLSFSPISLVHFFLVLLSLYFSPSYLPFHLSNFPYSLILSLHIFLSPYITCSLPLICSIVTVVCACVRVYVCACSGQV